jgi:hypothetical protein
MKLILEGPLRRTTKYYHLFEGKFPLEAVKDTIVC